MSSEDKARRLWQDGCVVEEDARVFTVEGDSDTYTVVVYGGEEAGVSCNCEHGRFRGREASCSHAKAAALKVCED